MLKAKRIVTRLTAVGGAAAICVSSSAVAAATGATLSSTEYRELATSTAMLNKSASAKSINWTRARAGCRQVGTMTALLRTQRATCLATVNVLDALASFPAEQRRCSVTTSSTTGTTTTGTTTTGTSTTAANSAVIRLMVCMNTHYQALGRQAKTIYESDLAAHKQAVARGFTGACLATLAPTPGELRTVRTFSLASGRLAADVTLLLKVTQGKEPSSAFSQARIDNDVKQFETSATVVLAAHGQQKLSVCPHQ